MYSANSLNRKFISRNSAHLQSCRLQAMLTGEMLRAKARGKRKQKTQTQMNKAVVPNRWVATPKWVAEELLWGREQQPQ